jgi:hypothetical protein
MTGAPTDLLVECEAHGIRLTLVGDDRLSIDAPQAAFTPDLLARLKANKADLLAMLRPAPTYEAPAKPAKAVCRCGGTTWRDVTIHGGQSIRRDCGRCGRFLNFPLWYRKNTGHNGQ